MGGDLLGCLRRIDDIGGHIQMILSKFLLILVITYTYLPTGLTKPEVRSSSSIVMSVEEAALQTYDAQKIAKNETKDINYGPWMKVDAVLYEIDLEGGRVRKVGIPGVKVG